MRLIDAPRNRDAKRAGGGNKKALARLHSAGSLNRSHCCAAEGGGSFTAPTGHVHSFASDAHEFTGKMKDVGPPDEMFQVPYAAVEYALDIFVERSIQAARPPWRSFVREKPGGGQIVDLVWRISGTQQVRRSQAQYRIIHHYHGHLGYTGPHFYLLGDLEMIIAGDTESARILLLDAAEFLLWQPIPAHPTPEEIKAAAEAVND